MTGDLSDPSVVTRMQLPHERGDGSVSKLHVTVTVENLDGSGQGMDADFICLVGDVEISSAYDRPDLDLIPSVLEQFMTRRLRLGLTFDHIELPPKLTIRTAGPAS